MAGERPIQTELDTLSQYASRGSVTFSGNRGRDKEFPLPLPLRIPNEANPGAGARTQKRPGARPACGS